MSCGDQSAHINTRCFTKVHTLRVDQNNLARRGNAAQDLAGLRVSDAIKRSGLSIGLLKIDCGVFADVEGTPVKDCFWGGLVDVECVARLTDRGLPPTDLSASG